MENPDLIGKDDLYIELYSNVAEAMEKHRQADWPVTTCFKSMVDAAYDTIKGRLDAAKKHFNMDA